MTTENALRIRGVAASPGVAHGPWVRYERRTHVSRGVVTEPEAEVARLIAATEAVARASERLADQVRGAGHADEAEVFSAHAMIARDPDLLDAAAARIRTEGADATAAITAAAGTVADQLRALGDALLAGRAADVIDVGDRVARELSGLADGDMRLAEPSIVVALDLPPSLTATLPRDRLLGIALEASSPTAHAAILARAYGIPAVVGATGLLAALDAAGAGSPLALDGESGEILVAPTKEDVARYEARAGTIRRDRGRDVEEAGLPAVTKDGTKVELVANIGSPGEAAGAVALGARGVGLFRTEFLFLERSSPPSEDEQAKAYGDVVAAFAPHPVTIRLLDVGGDKPIPYLPLKEEDNPFLGVRALRLADRRPDIFVTQLRACLRAAVKGRVKVMAPMVADAGDVAMLRQLADRARAEMVREGRPIGEIDLGVMLEIPSAILTADTYVRELKFVSIGTNDLLQYTLAADRGNPALERYRDSLHPALLQLVRLAVEAAERAGIELSICGEMAGDPAAALVLVGLGVRVLSVSPSSIAAVRRALRGAVRSDLERIAMAGLGDASAADVRRRLQD
ncbi:MAG TPA: phosphoenolpyruvate--protein phosphotransferase [Candidatus Limnocylindria bacterium]|nr:phosphoenolpyruvate--protein phosphotransferase [Candidatus Limnocylindria bacterium]